MATRQTGNLLHGIRQMVAARAVPSLPDQELLERFVRQQDQAAFAALVERHGAMVLAVCRRTLGHLQDAEDACQASFLVLARKAASLRRKASLASWLHRVAYHVAADLRRDLARRRGREEPSADIVGIDTTADITWRELRTVLDEELHRLPERYRAPLILCYLEGKTRDEAATDLGWSVGSLKARLERGRERLRVRLVRRGLLLPAALFAADISQSAASTAVPATLAVATVKAASLIAAGETLRAGAVSATVAALTEGALQAMFVTKLKMIAMSLLVTAAVGVGAGRAWSTFGVAASEAAVLQVMPIDNDETMVKVRWKLVRGGDVAAGKGAQAPPQGPKPKEPPVNLPRGLEFLQPIPEFHGFRFGQDEATIRRIAKEQGLAVEGSAKGGSLILTRADGETLALSMRGGACSGIQRLGGGRLAAPTKEGEAVRDRKADEELVARLVRSLDDADDAVRGSAIHELRLLARRADISGAKRTRRGSEFDPKVNGLVPVLIRASADKADANRVAALYALADTLDPEAVTTIRARLKDESETVRFNAACLLTEFHDASGLPEMKKALKRLREQQPAGVNAFDTERLLASFERITGKSFGDIPMNPLITSDSRAAAAATQRYRELLDTWAAWWDWVPPRN